MKLLLDTHAFIWLVGEPGELSRGARSMLRDPANQLVVSIASLWEMGIKSNRGSLTLSDPLPRFVRRGLHDNSISLMEITLEHVFRFEELPRHHKDPFDRMIVAQSLEEGIPVVGRDRMLDEYGVDRRW